MKKINLITLLFMLPLQAVAQDPTISGTEFFAEGAETKDLIIKSTTGLCHGKESSFKSRLIINNGGTRPTPTYSSYEECLKDGGRLPKPLQKLAAEGNIEGLTFDEVVDAESKGKEETSDRQKFAGINWGVGLAAVHFSSDMVEDVSINDGIVSVDFARSDKAIVLLESHFFFTDTCLWKICWGPDTGIGPFISIGVTGEDGVDPLETYGFGLMYGKRIDESKQSWNVGVGLYVDSKAEILRSGIYHGAETDIEEPANLTVERDKSALMVIFSASW